MQTKVAIVGTGPGGTTCALFLEKAGIDCVLIEKDQFPRFHIGESMTGECGNAVRALGLESKMMAAPHPVKHGVTVYGAGGKNSFWVPVMARMDGELKVGTTWQVRRSEFDRMLLDATAERNIPLVHGRAKGVLRDGERVTGVEVEKADGAVERIEADVVVDASGQSTFLAQVGVLQDKQRGNYNKQVAIYNHIEGANRDPGDAAGNTIISYQKPHHWAWFIPIDDKVTSIGVVVPATYFAERGESRDEFLKRELKELNPQLEKRAAGCAFVEETRAASNYSYHIKKFTGPGYLCVGDSHRFIDPVFSFGLHFAMSEGRSAAEAIGQLLSGESAGMDNPFAEYEMRSEQGQDVIQALIDAFWTKPLAFGFMAHERYRDDFIDMFAGRVWMDNPSEGLRAIQRLTREGGADRAPD